MPELTDHQEDALYERIARIIEEARTLISRTVNTAMVHAYWLIGREIVEVEQQGRARAGYGDELIKQLAGKLTQQFGRGFTTTSLKRMRQFYRAFPEGSRLPAELAGPEKGASLGHLSAGNEKGRLAPAVTGAGGLGALELISLPFAGAAATIREETVAIEPAIQPLVADAAEVVFDNHTGSGP